ncbi:MAG TPA: hypothetical protein VH083_19755 [Myxococcales bacterium]|jgi:hypothetical protein|nr:hypothetical protein [Myxococcales bacterium]
MTLALLIALSSILSNQKVAVADGTDSSAHSHDAVVVDLNAKNARFVKQGEPLAATGRSIIIDLLAPPEGALPNPKNLRAPFDRPGIEKLLENDRVTVWRYTWQKDKKTPLHFHRNDVVVVYTAEGTLASITPDGKTQMNPHTFGFTKFSPKGRIHYEELVKGEASAVMVELK